MIFLIVVVLIGAFIVTTAVVSVAIARETDEYVDPNPRVPEMARVILRYPLRTKEYDFVLADWIAILAFAVVFALPIGGFVAVIVSLGAYLFTDYSAVEALLNTLGGVTFGMFALFFQFGIDGQRRLKEDRKQAIEIAQGYPEYQFRIGHLNSLCESGFIDKSDVHHARHALIKENVDHFFS